MIAFNVFRLAPACMLACLLAFAPGQTQAEECLGEPFEKTLLLATDLSPGTPFYARVKALYDDFFCRIGYAVEFRFMSAGRAELEFLKGYIDGDFFRIFAFGEKHPHLIRVNEPLVATEFSIYARQDRFRSLTSLAALKKWDGEPLSIGYPRGMLGVEVAVKDVELEEKHRLFSTADQYQGMYMLREDRLDLVLASKVFADILLGRQEMRQSGIFRAGILATHLGYIYLLPDYRDLAPRLAEAIRASKADGTFERLAGVPPAP